MLTFITAAINPPNSIQMSAMNSWQLAKIPTIIGGAQDQNALSKHFPGMRFVPDIRTAKTLGFVSDTPVVKDLISKSFSLIETPMMALINADIVVQPNFIETLSKIVSKYGPEIVLSGSRYDITYVDIMAHPEKIQECFQKTHSHQGHSGDIFISSRGIFDRLVNAMPDFLMGRMLWDNWMHQWFQNEKYPKFNINPQLSVFHFTHGYEHLSVRLEDNPEVKHNVKLMGSSKYNLIDVNSWKVPEV